MLRIRVTVGIIVFLLGGLLMSMQELEPVKWTGSMVELEDGKYKLTFTAQVDEHWHVYSQFLDTTQIGPAPTRIDFEGIDGYALVGGTEESAPIVKEDPVFEMEVAYFEGTATFTQIIQAGDGAPPNVRGYINFMACDEMQCIFPDPLPFDLHPGDDKALEPGILSEEGDHSDDMGIEEPVHWKISSSALGNDEYELNFHADIDPHWHLYSQHLESDFGPIPTTFSFADSTDGFKLMGETSEGTPIVAYDPNFEMDLHFYETTADFKQKIKATPNNKGKASGTLTFMVCDDKKCLPPEDIDFTVNLKTGVGLLGMIEGDVPDGPRLHIATVDTENPKASCVASSKTKDTQSLWKLFLLGVGGGLIALLTPCVFPMIPLTVSFFTKGSEDKAKGLRKAITYGFFIFLIYILLSIPFHLMDSISPDILNEISTNVPLNIFFFVIFLIFAFSFFGYFELTLPSSFTNKMDDKASSAGGVLGIFFMALTLALVSFSCTGPILGSLLAGSLSSDGGAMQLTAGMGGFGFALALPFAVFAAFPGMMNSLPQSGGWLNSVKVILGFAEVALAFKFLSNADLVVHWNLLKYETFMIIWILCSAGIVFYLLGKIKFPHDSPVGKLGLGRVFFATVFALFTAYLISGFMYDEEKGSYQSLSLLSGLAPPVGYSYMYPLDCPHDLDCFHDYFEGMAHAKKVGKPVLVDFTGYACVNCRKMEENVWNKPGIFEIIRDDYVLISLYVDDKKELPETQQRNYKTKSGRVKKLKTYGNLWSTMQSETFQINSQPYYALLSEDGELLTNSVGYTPEVSEYQAFLECGINAHKGMLSVK